MASKMARSKGRPKQPATYTWKPGCRIPVKADVAAASLEEIRAERGVLTPGAVVEAARDPGHPLHKAFTWDNDEAAEKYRLHQARHLIHNIVVSYIGADAPPQIAYVNVTYEDHRSYMPVARVLSSEALTAQMLEEAMNGLEGWTRRYRSLSELAEIHRAIDKVKAQKVAATKKRKR